MRGNPSKLQPVRTKQEASERGRRGGIASGKARRERSDVIKMLKDALGQRVVDGDGKKTTNAAMMVANMIKKARAGDLMYVKEVLDRIYGKPAQTVDMQSSDGSMSPTTLCPMSFEQWKNQQEE